MASLQSKPSSGTASKIASCLSFWTSTGKWSPIRLILVTYRPKTSWVISSRAKQNMETLYEGPQTAIVVFAIRSVHATKKLGELRNACVNLDFAPNGSFGLFTSPFSPYPASSASRFCRSVFRISFSSSRSSNTVFSRSISAFQSGHHIFSFFFRASPFHFQLPNSGIPYSDSYFRPPISSILWPTSRLQVSGSRLQVSRVPFQAFHYHQHPSFYPV